MLSASILALGKSYIFTAMDLLLETFPFIKSSWSSLFYSRPEG